MDIQHHGHEHEFEPEHGLPERLPAGEHILWQGAPDFAALARHAFHLRKLAVYFALLLGMSIGTARWSGNDWLTSLAAVKLLAPLALLALGCVALLAWLTARTTVYTLTDRRVVVRGGIVLTVTFNIPLRQVASAGLRRLPGGHGDLCLALAGGQRIAWLQLWPNVRPWRLAHPEPMLRSLADADGVSQKLQQAWSALTGVATVPLAPQAAPASAPHTQQPWQVSPT
jgi:Bacterial PH domain